MKIIDDVMPVVMQDQLLDICTEPSFQWSFMPDSTYDKRQERIVGDMNKPSYPSMSHLAMNEYKPKSGTANLIAAHCLCLSDKANINPYFLHRMRFGLYLPLKDAPLHNNMHVDIKQPHTVILYYVNDADGDTFFFDRNRECVDRITPKKGRAVVFDGLTLHASSMPSKNYRISLNLGYADPQIFMSNNNSWD